MNDRFTQLIDKWAEDIGSPPPGSANAIAEPPHKGIARDLLVYGEALGWVRGDAAAVTALATSLYYDSPTVTGPLRPLEALALASACYRHELAPGPVADLSDTAAVARRIHQVLVRRTHDNTVSDAELLRRTVCQAVRDLNDLGELGLPRWVFSALDDHASGWYLSDDQYQRIALVCANRAPGRCWTHVAGLGFITWAQSTQPPTATSDTAT